ncbi:delta(3,5)-Delta(2,4)-dienoyl-CoA isomerase, mitochondrial [Episyrphus balteatus]|uniref:delta(3,5)-Delta(2,4)-dienoyl-CoA isomerase, mitochondrial n=1 Tax=Episyrphus balteatus TaxID=286459 RepID=UPI002486281B|nr:delta(3,5)-Delta(2,4)-dienoyl-CoA isomerase, mitochondrial [Episyrphus balteatus]
MSLKTILSSNLLSKNMVSSSMIRTMSSKIIPTSSTENNFKCLSVAVPKPFVYHVQLNRPDKYNAINKQMWVDIKDCFESLSMNPDCRVVVISAEGKHFTAGIDLNDMMQLAQELAEIEEVSRKGCALEKLIKLYQDSISSLEVCNKPVISAVHSACIGAGVDLITASDIRYCTKDAMFQVKEVEIGMAADVGTLQRFPKVINSQSLARELCLTGRKFLSDEAKSCGLVSKVFENKDEMIKTALSLAEDLASKSPIAVQATKKNIIYSFDRPNQEGLDQIREMNKLYLQSEDFINATMAQLTKGEIPTFSKL